MRTQVEKPSPSAIVLLLVIGFVPLDCGIVATSNAATVTYAFSGIVRTDGNGGVYNPDGLLPSSIVPGTPFQGSFEFDNDGPLAPPSNMHVSYSRQTASSIQLTIDGGFSFSITGGNDILTVQSGTGGGSDAFLLAKQTSLHLPAGNSIGFVGFDSDLLISQYYVQLSEDDLSRITIPSPVDIHNLHLDLLPFTPPGGRSVAIIGTSVSGGYFSISGLLTTLELVIVQPVPEPSTFALLGLGAIGLAIRTRRRTTA